MVIRSVLELIYEYQLLRAKRDRLDIPLDDQERARLIGLSQLLAGEGDRGRRAMPRFPFPTSVSFTLPGGFETGEVKNLSGEGLAIATAQPPGVGTRILVRVLDPTAACEYFFPCRVVWSRRTAPPGMGVAFDGMPTKNPCVPLDDTGVWKRSFHIGGPRKEVQAA
jgi:hypothetical protein